MAKTNNNYMDFKESEPDHELLVWEKWIQIRNDETKKLGKKLHKAPVDLTMNLLEKVREENEWKTALEHAQIENKPSIRGLLWEQPPRLKQHCYCKPVYEVHRTPAEKGKPAIIEHISVPKYIQEYEKGMKGVSEKKNCGHLDADFEKYKTKRENELKDKISKIDPFRPSASGLIVRGTKPKPPPKKLPPIPNIIMTPTTVQYEEVPSSVYAIRINKTVIYKNIPNQDLSTLFKLRCEPWHENCTSWSYYFNTPVKRAGRCKLYLENLGSVTLRYCWKKLKKSIPFIPEDIYEQVFFFNKNEDVLSPGQNKEMCFTFLSEKPGIYSEFWELSFCNIYFYDTISEKLTVNLYADSVENVESIRKKCDVLKSRIDKKAITNIVSDIIDDAISKAIATVPQQYGYKNLFSEADMFVMKNPVCFYHQTEVMKMKEYFTEMEPKEPWDLSITSWRETMIEQGFDDRMKFYNLLKKSHTELLKPWYEGEGVQQQKYRAMKLLFGQMANMFDKKYEELVLTYSSLNEQQTDNTEGSKTENLVVLSPVVRQKIRNVFYIHAYEYVSMTIEMCAGVLSSLDRNRWIDFDFCRL